MKTYETDELLRVSVLDDMKSMSLEQLEFRRVVLENRLPRISMTEGEELERLYAFFRLRK